MQRVRAHRLCTTLAKEACSTKRCTSQGPFAVEGLAQLQRWLIDRIARLEPTDREDFFAYLDAMPKLSLGTMCSGSDSPALVLPCVLRAAFEAKGSVNPAEDVEAMFEHLFSCEKDYLLYNLFHNNGCFDF